MSVPSPDPVPSNPGARTPAKPCATCGTYYTGDLCPKCVVGFAAQPTRESPPQITPYDETVRLGDRTGDLRPKSEPAIPDEALAAPPGARFGKFIRTQRLGAGGMGEVWKAWDSVLGRWVALKFLKGGDDEEIARFRREAQTAGRLHHPNIAAIYEVNEDQGRQYIAMQFVDGQNLHQFPRGDRMLLVRLMIDAARALQYAHEQGIIHRDLKPENLMVSVRSQQHHVFLMDFGLARITEGASKISATGFLVGTPMYMSPEQARGEKVDVRSDVYSLGLTLYELLTDHKPFESESVYETLRRVQETDPQALRQLNRRIAEDLETVVMKAIAKDPLSRYASAQDFADDLQAFLDGDPIRGKRESIHRKLLRRVRRHPLVFATGAVLVLGLATSGIIAIGASRDRRVTVITNQVEEALRAREWTDARLRQVQDLIGELGKIAPEQATSFHLRLPKTLAASIRAADLARARLELSLLERLDPTEAGVMAAELRQRETIWPSLFKLEAPFSDLSAVFDPSRVRVEGAGLRGSGAELTTTRKPCEGNVELKGEFDGAWKNASRLGLAFNPGQPSGYQFLLMTVDGNPPPSFQAIKDAEGVFRLQIRRGDVLLREERVKNDAIDLSAPLRVMAKREGDLLKFQVNDLNALEFQDPFALGRGPKGSFAVIWPAGAGLRRLVATHQELPPKPSRLEVGDELFLQGKAEEALDRYAEAGQAADAGPARLESLYKQGLCNLQLNREEEAKKIFQGLAAALVQGAEGSTKRWAFLADCQLLILYFREKDGIDRAAVLLDRLSQYEYTFDRLAVLMPPDVQRQVLNSVELGSVGSNFHRRPEDHLARTEFAVRASELLEPPSHRGEWSYHGLMRAYMMVGRDDMALRTADKSFRTFRYGGEVLDDYCWLRRLTGKQSDIQDALAAIDRGLAADPSRYVERARIHIALNDWAAASGDLELALSKTADYGCYSAACLMKGFLLEREGAPAEKVEETWRRGLLKRWTPPPNTKGLDAYDPARAPMGMPMLHDWMLSSLSGEMSDADAERQIGGLMSFAGRDNPVFNKLMRPSMLRAAWRTARGREVARHIAFRDIRFEDLARFPLYLGWISFIREVCFNPAEPLSSDQDELLWRMAGEIYASYREGWLTERYFLPFGAIVAGNPNAPGMGWPEVAKLLERNLKLRGPLAYVFGQRYVKKGDPKFALMFYRSASADADRDPPQPLLKKLAQTEIDALGK
jgi:tetratricopeptide (TPR) repeat protein/predicted Ser/Thr protein kinase